MGKLRAGGVESIMYSYYRCLDKEKYQYDFVYEKGSEFDVPEEILEMGARAFKISGIGNPFGYIRDLIRIIKKEKYSIIHTNLNSLSVFSLFAAWCCRVKYRILHNHTTSSPAEGKKTIIKKLLRPFCRAFANKACACSVLAAQWMYGEKAVEKGRVRILRNGVDTEKFSFDADARLEIRKEFKIENKKVIGHVGRFATTKNHRFIIDIFEKIQKKDSKTVLMLCGDGELFSDVKDYALAKGLSENIVFTGVRNDVNKLYSAFDVFVLPSLYEGLPIVAMEALCSGLNVYLSENVTRECAISEKVRFLPIDTPSHWVEGIEFVDEEERTCERNIMKGGDFDIYNCVKELEELYEECR